ncbi:uncharacterized protein Dvir_GJ13673 [Drosophila virilis]|uniref:Uncharacterized protein n=1 Tax=Drosophila virilis TaxID=7244 RepID=A0A0Q9WJ65_DROVI|nr:uncharacterized protein Dvir_GJ13673 [Drosophila virilis]
MKIFFLLVLVLAVVFSMSAAETAPPAHHGHPKFVRSVAADPLNQGENKDDVKACCG